MKKEQIAIIDGQMTVFDVLEDIEKNGLKPEPKIKPFVYEGRPSTPPGAKPLWNR
jgi:hypothetical protein